MTCRTCQHYDLAAVLNKAGRVQSGKAARCRWPFTYPMPDSITQSYGWVAPTGRYMEPNEGADCPTWEPRT